MTKLYYTDPRKALWMATEFGVRYENKTVFNLGHEIASIVTKKKKEWQIAPILITPSSHHIFEPKRGDIVIGNGKDVYNYYEELPAHIAGRITKIEDYRDVWKKLKEEPCYYYDEDEANIDLISASGEFGITLEDVSWNDCDVFSFLSASIIQRDNKAFFMPEV